MTSNTGSSGTKAVKEWKGRAVHEITCPSGAKVKVKLPNLIELIQRDALPSDLLATALKEVAADMAGIEPKERVESMEPDDVKGLYDLLAHLVQVAVVEPPITRDDFEGLPQEDLEFLMAIASRRRNTDALGVVLGVAPIELFQPFRDEHGCPPDCQACQAARWIISTARLNQV